MLMLLVSKRRLSVLFLVLLLVGLSLAIYAGDYKPPDLPQVFHAKTYPIHESHDNDYLQFKARAVEAHSTQAGFLFFDTSGMSDPLAGSHIYISGLRNGDGQELFYFDLPLRKAPANQDTPLAR